MIDRTYEPAYNVQNRQTSISCTLIYQYQSKSVATLHKSAQCHIDVGAK
jgi:hypothetical protein